MSETRMLGAMSGLRYGFDLRNLWRSTPLVAQHATARWWALSLLAQMQFRCDRRRPCGGGYGQIDACTLSSALVCTQAAF